MSAWIVYVRDGCHLCDSFLLDLSLELGPVFEEVRVVDVDSDPELAVKYGLRVPVLEFDGELVCEAHVDSARVAALTRL